jgi:hypothetical protein
LRAYPAIDNSRSLKRFVEFNPRAAQHQANRIDTILSRVKRPIPYDGISFSAAAGTTPENLKNRTVDEGRLEAWLRLPGCCPIVLIW